MFFFSDLELTSRSARSTPGMWLLSLLVSAANTLKKEYYSNEKIKYELSINYEVNVIISLGVLY
jgi:hypothetical protein